MQTNTDSLAIPFLNTGFNKIKISIFLVAVFIQISCVILFAYKGLIIAIAPILVISFILFTAFSVEKIFFFLCFYIIIFEEYYYAQYFPGLPIYYLWPLATGLFVLLLIYWLIYLLKNQTSFQIKSLDILIIIFLFFVILSTLNGLLRGYDAKSWRWDILPYPFYLSYFIFIYSKLKTKTKFFYNIVLLLSIPVALTMIYTLSQLKGAILLQRIVTQNIHMMQFAIPYAGLIAIYSQSLKRRIICTLLLPIFVLAVIISQQRALLFTTFLSSFVLFIIFIKIVYKPLKKNTKLILMLIMIAVLIIPFVIIESITKESLLLTFISRFYIFLNPTNFTSDASWQIRWQEIVRVLPQINENLIFGAGLGATTISRHRLILQITVDNSYVYVLWKMGIIGLLSFLSIHYMLIKRCRLVLKHTKIVDEKIFATTILLNTIGMLLIGVTNAGIAHYRFLFIWLALMASIELTARKYD